MNRTVWTLIFSLILTAALALGAYIVIGLLGIAIVLLLASLIGLTMVAYNRRVIVLNEMEVGVVFDRRTGNFVRFIVTPDPNPDAPVRRTPWWRRMVRPFLFILRRNDPTQMNQLDPYHFMLGPDEELHSKLPKGSGKTTGTAFQLRTREGITLDIQYTVEFFLDVNLILPPIRHKLARGLPANADKMVDSRVQQALKHIIETKTIHELYVADPESPNAQGAIVKLEGELRERLNGMLVNLGFKEIPLKDVRLGPIKMPPQIEQALKIDHQRELQTATVTKSLSELHQAIRTFTDDDLQRLNELERLRILDTRAIFVNMSDMVVNKNKQVVHNGTAGGSGLGPTNGRSPDHDPGDDPRLDS